ncbi:MAG: sensor histidine kinase [Clostridia bacterium]|nr:sensor histidine kinase [Clostridia bacterium]
MKSIKFKLLAALSIGFILILSFVMFNNNRISNITAKNNQSVIDSLSNLSNEYIGYLVKKSNDIAIILSNNSQLNTISRSTKFGEAGTNIAISALAQDVLYQTELNENIESIYIYLEDEKIFIDSYGQIFTKETTSTVEWAKKYATSFHSIRWVETKDDRYPDLELISIIYRADNFNSNLSSPVFVSINYEKQQFVDLISRTKVGDTTITALINYDDDIFICETDVLAKIDIRSIIYEKKDYLTHNRESEVDITGFGTGKIIFTPLKEFDGAIVLFIPDQVTEVISDSERILIVSSGAVILLIYLLLMLSFVKRNIDEPISKLLGSMKKTGEGIFSETIKDSRKDEFGQLFSAYNIMVHQVENLIQELYQQQLVKSELELKVLQEKINPHFLYNTLDTINWIAKEHQINDISKMVIDLSTMYRMTFNKGNDLISIKDMLVGVSCYLSIQKIRYGDTFSYEFKVDPQLMEYEILNLIVQTLVENSIVHGMSEKTENGLVTVMGKVEKSNLIIEVVDNGVGMSEEKLYLITSSINSNMIGSESGLRNVQKRIKLYYGEEYSISIESEAGRGTKVTIVLPYEGDIK